MHLRSFMRVMMVVLQLVHCPSGLPRMGLQRWRGRLALPEGPRVGEGGAVTDFGWRRIFDRASDRLATHLLSQIQERGRGRVGFGEGKTKDASYERAITLPLLRLNLPQYVFHAKGYFGKGLWHLT